jgi:indole-3-glycerol phosphate synthase
MAMTKDEKAKFDAALADMLKNPEKHKKAFIAAAKKESPEMTDEQIEANWAQATNQLL